MSEPNSISKSDLSRVKLVSTGNTSTEIKTKTIRYGIYVPYIIGGIIFLLIFVYGFYIYGKNIAPPPSPIIKKFGITLVSQKQGIAMAAGIQRVIQSDGKNCGLFPVIVGVRAVQFGADVNTGWKLTDVSRNQPNIVSLQNVFTGKYPTDQFNLTTHICEPGPRGLLSLISSDPGPINVANPSATSEAWFEITSREANKQVTDFQGNTKTFRTTYLTFRSIAQSTPDVPKYLMVGPLFPNFGGAGTTQYHSIIVDKLTTSSDHMFEAIS